MRSFVLEIVRAKNGGNPHDFEFTPQEYLLRHPGGAYRQATFPWTQQLLADLEHTSLPSGDPGVIQRVGDTLQKFLTDAGWDQYEAEIRERLRRRERVIVTIRPAAAEMYALPWERATLRASGEPLGRLPDLLLRYAWPGEASLPDPLPPADRCGRVLLAHAGRDTVPWRDQVDALQAALADRPGVFDPARDVIPEASLAAIERALAAAERVGPKIDAVHLLCHGTRIGSSFGLALHDEAGKPARVDADQVQQIFGPYTGMVRLVVLAACDSGNVGTPGHHLGSVAQKLHRVGVAAVIASRYPISAAGSTLFARAFYPVLAHRGASLEDAFLAGRGALHSEKLDWASMQLFGHDAAEATGVSLGTAAPRTTTSPAAPPLPVLAPAAAEPSASTGGAARAPAGVDEPRTRRPRNRPTHTAIVLDRHELWKELLDKCAGDRHFVFIVHGDVRQSVALFVERIERFLEHECPTRHRILRIDRRGEALAVDARDWEAITIQSTDLEQGTLKHALRTQTRHEACILLYVDGNAPLRDLDRASVDGLAGFLCGILPDALALAQSRHPIRVILPVEQDEALVATLRKALAAHDAVEHIETPALEPLRFPAWEAVEPTLQTIQSEFGVINVVALGDCRSCHAAAEAAQTSVRTLGDDLHAILFPATPWRR